MTSSTGAPLRPKQKEWPLSTPGQGEDLSGDVRPSNGRSLSEPGCQKGVELEMTKHRGGGRRSLIKTPGSPPPRRDRSVEKPGSATRGRGRAEPRTSSAGAAPRRAVRMEPAAGFLSPRPFPRAAAPSSPPAGPGPPASASPRSEPGVLAGPQTPDASRLITDPRSGRTYIKGRLLGKVGRGSGVALTEVEGSSADLTGPLRSVGTDDAASSF